MVRRWVLASAGALLLAALPGERQPPVEAQALRRAPPGEVRLGDGVSVQWDRQLCGVGPCGWYRPVGFSFGELPILAGATTFAHVPSTGRIVAAFSWQSPVGGQVIPSATDLREGALAFTDDLGEQWHLARWPWYQPATAIAFDASSLFGVAVGPGGYVWNTEDGGASWVSRRGGAGLEYVRVYVLGRLCVLVDTDGVHWRSRDGGFARERLVEDPGAQVGVDAHAIVVRARDLTFTLRPNGEVERQRR